MRKSSPGNRSRGAGRSRTDSASAVRARRLRLRPSASSSMRSASWRIAESGQELRPRAQRLFELRREAAPARRDPCRETPPASSASAAASASSLTTAAGLPCGLRLRSCFAQLELQPPAMLADFRIGPDFERADFGQTCAPASPAPAARRLCRSAARRSAARADAGPLALRRKVDDVAGLDRRCACSELYSRNDTGLLATSCRLPGSSSTVEPSSAPRGTRHNGDDSPSRRPGR